jgi:hypothetical protein
MVKTLLHDFWCGVVNNTLFTLMVLLGFCMTANWHYADVARDDSTNAALHIEQSGRIMLAKEVKEIEFQRRQDRLDLYFDLGIYEHRMNQKYQHLSKRLSRTEGKIKRLQKKGH